MKVDITPFPKKYRSETWEHVPNAIDIDKTFNSFKNEYVSYKDQSVVTIPTPPFTTPFDIGFNKSSVLPDDEKSFYLGNSISEKISTLSFQIGLIQYF